MAGQWGEGSTERSSPLAFRGGAALIDREGGAAWLLVDDGEIPRFGAALALCSQSGVESGIRILVEEVVPGAAGVIARRASAFGGEVSVWRVDGRSLVAAEPAPPPIDVGEPAGGAHGEGGADPGLVQLLAAHGVEPVFEHGVLRGEFLGLEVARVIDDRLAVGVGRHDRDARAEMRPGEDLGSALDSAVKAVRRWRRPGAASHPANTLARARWLRSVLCARPASVGLRWLKPVPPPLPWFDLPEAGAAPGVGADYRGNDVVVVCSVGVELDLVPTAADSRLLYGSRPDVPLWLVVPSGDDVPVTRRLAGMLRHPASVVTVTREWQGLAAAP